MKNIRHHVLGILLTLLGHCTNAQQEPILQAPPTDRLPLLWRYCVQNLISDGDSATTNCFLNNVIQGADRLGDERLKAYAQFFQKVWRIFFSVRYEQYFPNGYLQAIGVVNTTRTWALKTGYPDIAAACDYLSGLIYNRADRYGLASESLLKAHAAFTKIGYGNLPNAAGYLYDLGLHFYRFEEYDKALEKLLQATQYRFYIPRIEVSAWDAIAMIYARKREFAKACRFFKTAMAKATQYNDSAWIGIAAGSLGNVLLAEGRLDSALFYHRINYSINAGVSNWAPDDAARTALSMATLFLRKAQPDSASFYINAAKSLAARFITDSADRLEFRKRWLEVQIDYRKRTGDLGGALLLTDSLFLVEGELRSKLDGKILSRAVEKTEAEAYSNQLALLKSQKDVTQLRSYIVICVLLILFIVASMIFRDKWLRRKRQIQLTEKDRQLLLAEKLRAEESLMHSKELLRVYIDAIKEKTQLIQHLEEEITGLKSGTAQGTELETIAASREKLMVSTLLTDADWQQFRTLFEQVHPGFSFRLKTSFPDLSPAEARALFLIKLHLSSREMATMLGISVDSMYKLRYRLRKKLNLDEDGGFETVLRKIDEGLPVR